MKSELFATGLVICLVAGCDSASPAVAPYTSVDQVFSEPVFRAFADRSGIGVRPVFDTEETKSVGVLNRLLSEARNPQADVFWSGDPVRPFLLVRRGLVEPYVSPQAVSIPKAFKSSEGLWTGFAARARVLLVNTRLVPKDRRPRSVRDLADPAWRGLTTMASPLYGTTTMHVAALATVWGEEATQRFLADLRANGIRLASSNGEVKRLVAAGEAAFGLTDTDDASAARREGAPVEIVYPDQDAMGTLVMPTTLVLIRGGPNPDSARRLIDHLLSE